MGQNRDVSCRALRSAEDGKEVVRRRLAPLITLSVGDEVLPFRRSTSTTRSTKPGLGFCQQRAQWSTFRTATAREYVFRFLQRRPRVHETHPRHEYAVAPAYSHSIATKTQRPFYRGRDKRVNSPIRISPYDYKRDRAFSLHRHTRNAQVRRRFAAR